MQSNFNSAANIKANLFGGDNIDNPTLQAIYDDPFYGLSNLDNYAKWQALMSTSRTERRQFQTELMSFYGLSRDQVREAAYRWAHFFNSTQSLVKIFCPTQDCTTEEVAYWQWALSSFTTMAVSQTTYSVSQMDPTTLGYPEIYAFKMLKLLPAVEGTKYYNQFKDITYGDGAKSITMAYLFAT